MRISREETSHSRPRTTVYAGTLHHDKRADAQQFFHAMPEVKLAQGIHADDEMRVAGRILRPECRQRIHRIGYAAAFGLQRADIQSRVVGHRQAHHGQPVGDRGQRLAHLVGRRVTGHQEHPVQATRLPHGLRHQQMAGMDRIEGAAENADFFMHSNCVPIASSLSRIQNSVVRIQNLETTDCGFHSRF